MKSSGFWVLLAMFAGALLALQARVNSELAVELGDGVAAALVSFLAGLAILIPLSIFVPGARAGFRSLRASLRGGMPWWHCLGGVIGAFVVSTQGIAAGVLGIAVYTVGIVAGQTISGVLVDRFGFASLPKRAISLQRILGAILTLLAVSLALLGGGAIAHPLLMLLPFIAGLLVSIQQALNGEVQRASGSVIASTALNFTLGTIALALFVVVRVLGGLELDPLPLQPLLYLGGIIGAMFVGVAALAVRHIGVLLLGLAMISGQLLAALLVDLVWPSALHSGVTTASVVGALLALLGVIASSVRRRRPPQPLV
ncbi:DMT family transporter [Humidisolicoccus flavus]|uniref:DMT family transporter n=1 Tax=Humidisolicoccus flavus TaxID=3111414 RepID=UPI0032568727